VRQVGYLPETFIYFSLILLSSIYLYFFPVKEIKILEALDYSLNNGPKYKSHVNFFLTDM